MLIVQPSRLGDVLLSSTLLDDLHRAFPEARLDYLTRESAAPLLDGHPLIGRVVRYTASLRRDVRAIRQGHYDWVIDPHGGTGAAMRTLLSGAFVRAGFAVRIPRRYAYTHRLPRGGPEARYTADQRKGLLAMLGVEIAHSRPRLRLSDGEREAGRAALAAAGVSLAARVLGMNITGATVRQSWPLASAVRVARRASAAGLQCVLFASPGDQERVDAFSRATSGVIVVSPRPLRDFLAMIPACSVFASGDTGPSHFAMAAGVPTVTLYSKGRAETWNPRAPDTLVLEAPPSFQCAACTLAKRETDRAEHACLASIGDDEWMDAISRALRLR